jgi:hypothetical protein
MPGGARAGEAEARAARAKEYLVKVRGIDARRIVTIDGGHREDLTVELYIVPSGDTPPFSTPTVDPNDVQVIKASDTKTTPCSTRPRCKRWEKQIKQRESSCQPLLGVMLRKMS